MIAGVKIKPLAQTLDERGKVMSMLRADERDFAGFGEIYFSWVYPGVVKGWHLHRLMTLNYAVPHGNIKLVLYDPRAESPTQGEIQELFLGPDNYCLITIPPLIWSGFKGIGTTAAMVANCSTIPHDPAEIQRLDPTDPSIPYVWEPKQR
jgi:dTDP-4-dehydrorhamnose 3,5-epimerase